MSRFGIGQVARFLALAVVTGIAATQGLHAQSIAGHWQGSRTGRNPMNGTPFTVNFVFDFGGDGSYREEVSFGTWKILQLTGIYQLGPGRKSDDPTITNILSLRPQDVQTAPNEQVKMMLEAACVANTDATDQYVTFFNVAPLGGMMLKNTAGGDTWGMNRMR